LKLVFRFLSRIKFLLSATNQHGVHSPFVYNFLTKGLYRKGNKTFSPTENVLVKSISYFSYQNIGMITNSNELKTRLNFFFENLEFTTLPFDLIYVNAQSKPFKNIGKEYIHNETMLIVDGIYQSRERTRMWNELKKQDYIRVTIDTYHCGIIFFRKEQVKEHFKIRI